MDGRAARITPSPGPGEASQQAGTPPQRQGNASGGGRFKLKSGGKKRAPLPIDDVFQFEAIMARVQELAVCLPDCQADLVHLLGLLIADALSELTGPKFDWPRRAGDLDDANGILHLLNDYPASVPPGKFWKESFLHVEEEAAAQWLLKLYLARDYLQLGFGLPPETAQEIERFGLKLVAWRLHGPAYLRDLAEKQATEARRRAEQAETAIAENAPATEHGKELLSRLEGMRDSAKRASTLYPEESKEAWRRFDENARIRADRERNKSDRVRAVLKEFGLPESTTRTVRRALFGK